MFGRRRRQQAQAAEQAQAAQPPPEAEAPAASAAAEQPAYMVELEQLNQLKAQGVINDEEFEAKKKQLLGI